MNIFFARFNYDIFGMRKEYLLEKPLYKLSRVRDLNLNPLVIENTDACL